MAAVASETEGFLADAPALPGWESVARVIRLPGCVFHFRRVTGAYASKNYGFEYSREAMKGPKGWRPLVYNVPVVVTRPTADGGTETLPERLAIRAVCLMPRSDRGTAEAIGGVEAILQAMGILDAKKIMADAGLEVPGGEAPSWVPAALRWARERLSARPLSAAESDCTVAQAETKDCAIEMDELVATGTPTPIPISCPAGFDYEGTTRSCRLSTNLGGGGADPGGANPGGSGGGDPGNNNNGEPNLRDVEFTLSCPGSVTRGSSAVCRVGTDDEDVIASTINYNWSAGGNGKSGLGRAFVSWSGLATSTKTISVKVSAPDIKTKNLSATVHVGARSAFFPSSAAGVSTAHFKSATTWGRFDVPTKMPVGPSVTQGQGPWLGEWIASRGYDVPTEIVLSSDLDATGVAYGGANQTCLTSLTATATVNVYGANYRCGLSSELARLYTVLLAHEQEHERSWNTCLASSTGSAFIGYAEGVLPQTGSEAKVDLDRKWEQFWPTLLASAYGSITNRTGPTVWSWRASQTWQKYQHDAPGHGIALGC
jgi:hypothetical protein